MVTITGMACNDKEALIKALDEEIPNWRHHFRIRRRPKKEIWHVYGPKNSKGDWIYETVKIEKRIKCINYKEMINGEPSPCLSCNGNNKDCIWFRKA